VHGEEDVPGPDDCILQGRLKNSETLDVLDSLLAHLPVDGWEEVVVLIQRFPGLFSDTPTRTHLIKHDIDVRDADPIHQRFYRVSSEKLRCLDAEVRYMLESDIAVPLSPVGLLPVSWSVNRMRQTDFVRTTTR
jgi:hypothetical protein